MFVSDEYGYNKFKKKKKEFQYKYRHLLSELHWLDDEKVQTPKKPRATILK